MISVSHIRPSDIRDYAIARGWKVNSHGEEYKRYIMSHADVPRRQLVFPVDTSVDDYSESIELIIGKLAVIENRPVEDILRSVSQVGRDVIDLRLIGKGESDLIPLGLAGAVVQGVRDLLMAAACAAIDPRLYYPRLYRKLAAEALASFYFGHTRRGSFVLNVSCPISSSLGGHPSFRARPMARVVTQALMCALNALVKGVDDNGLSEDTARNNYVSSNLCEIIYGLKNYNFDLEFNAAWSGNLPLNGPAISNVFIPGGHFNGIREIGQQLRSQSRNEYRLNAASQEIVKGIDGERIVPPFQHFEQLRLDGISGGELVGTVDALMLNQDEDEKSTDGVLLKILTADGRQLTALAKLNKAQYQVAETALIGLRRFVNIIGRLSQEGQGIILTDITRFDLI